MAADKWALARTPLQGIHTLLLNHSAGGQLSDLSTDGPPAISPTTLVFSGAAHTHIAICTIELLLLPASSSRREASSFRSPFTARMQLSALSSGKHEAAVTSDGVSFLPVVVALSPFLFFPCYYDIRLRSFLPRRLLPDDPNRKFSQLNYRSSFRFFQTPRPSPSV